MNMTRVVQSSVPTIHESGTLSGFAALSRQLNERFKRPLKA